MSDNSIYPRPLQLGDKIVTPYGTHIVDEFVMAFATFKVGDRVITPDGEGYVSEINPVFNIVVVNLGGGGPGHMYTTDQLTGTTGPAPKGNGCEHNWQAYTGLNQSFQFCTKCDTKKT